MQFRLGEFDDVRDTTPQVPHYWFVARCEQRRFEGPGVQMRVAIAQLAAAWFFGHPFVDI